MQERCLSRRTLHFARDMLYWECAEDNCSEIHPRTWPEQNHFYAFQSPYPKYRLEITDWPILVRRYSNAKLTNLTDKLVAIAGIAKAVRHEDAGEYIAGMWRRNLELQLCWKTILLERPESVENVPYIAPTWSWASVNDGVTLKQPFDVFSISAQTGPTLRRSANGPHQGMIDRHVFVKDVVQKTTTDSFGPIQGARLTTRCTILLHGCAIRSDIIFHDEQFFPPRSHVWPNYINNRMLGFEVSFDAMHHAEQHEPCVYVLPIFTYWRGEIGETRGLVLEATGNKQGEFRRIGVAWARKGVNPVPPESSPYDRFAHLDLVRLDDRSHFTEVLEKEDGAMDYLIDLV
jgi:hypothetical protein